MTIRLADLTIAPDADQYLSPADGQRDVTFDETFGNDILSMVRHIMRERTCYIVPIVRTVVFGPVNEYGHNAQIEVTYGKKGWRAIYGAHVAEKVTKVQCYMD